MKVGLTYILDKTRYFALLSRKWQYFILKRQETGTEHVAIATLKCVPYGIFRRVQHPCQVSIALLYYWRRFLILCHTTLLAQPVTSSVHQWLNLHNWKT